MKHSTPLQATVDYPFFLAQYEVKFLYELKDKLGNLVTDWFGLPINMYTE